METVQTIKWDVAVNGITYERACELEGHEYPRMATAVFRFDELSPAEQSATIAAKQTELVQAKEDKARILKEVQAGYQKIKNEQANGIFYGGQDSMIKPVLHRRKTDAAKYVKRLTETIANLEARRIK